MGVAQIGTDYYLGTLGDGLYKSAGGGTPTPVADYEDEEIIGLTAHSGNLYTVHPRKIRCMGITENIAAGNFTSAISGWKWIDDQNNTYNLLLVGLRRSSGTFGYGYREINLDPSGTFPAPLHIPGADNPTSVDNRSQYTSAIGKYVVNHIWVVSESKGDNDGRPIIFASTAKDGLWSYRLRDGNAQWNGE